MLFILKKNLFKSRKINFKNYRIIFKIKNFFKTIVKNQKKIYNIQANKKEKTKINRHKDIKRIKIRKKIKVERVVKMYKLLAIDLDGTMLNTYGEVSEKTKRVLEEANKIGAEVVISSGRTIDSIRNIAEEVSATKYTIAGNGALLYDLQNNKVMYEKYISKQKALKIIKICDENSIMYSVYTDKTIVAHFLKYNILYYYKENIKKPQSKKTSITLVQDIYDYVRNMQDENVMKIFICDKHKSIFNSITKKIKGSIEDIEILDVSHMSRKIIVNGSKEVPLEYFYTEITESDTDKWNALEYLLKKLNISKDEVISIGDNVNDIKMVENAGLGIAMKGSTPKLISVADYVTEEDNNHDGVANALEKYLL